MVKQELYDYDIFPKVFLIGTARTLTLRPLGFHAAFEAGHPYSVRVCEAERADERRFPLSGGEQPLSVTAGEDGSLSITADFVHEGMYEIQIRYEADARKMLEMRVYALREDMAGRYPFRGDLHMHTRRSDGREAPAVVAANYRGHGYDFTVISDHYRYYPSLEARKFWGISDETDQSTLTDLLIVPGEEVHLPLNDVHYVNFGGRFSINALVTPSRNEEKAGTDKAWRSLDGRCPDPVTKEEFIAEIRRRAEKVPRAIGSERLSFAAAQWIYEQQKKAGGIGIFPHPYWMTDCMQLSQDYLDFFYREHPFDAFEVLGGENYYQHNGFQTVFYYEQKAKGIDYPIVGSTDSHGSTEHNRNALICSTIVLAPANTTDALVKSILGRYSVAVDTISSEYRLVGDLRLVKYASFLMEEYFPLHDRLCAAEGEYMRAYAAGTPGEAKAAERVLRAMKGQIPVMLRKYFDL